MKRTPYKRAKDYAWKWMSQYIRLKEALETTGTAELGICVTCNRQYPVTELQGGHFIPGRSGLAMWREENVHSQCYGCNIKRHGAVLEYRDYIVERYGEEMVDELRRDANTPCYMLVADLQTLGDDYKRKCEEIKNNYYTR